MIFLKRSPWINEWMNEWKKKPTDPMKKKKEKMCSTNSFACANWLCKLMHSKIVWLHLHACVSAWAQMHSLYQEKWWMHSLHDWLTNLFIKETITCLMYTFCDTSNCNKLDNWITWPKTIQSKKKTLSF